jgi:hypothetical protein
MEDGIPYFEAGQRGDEEQRLLIVLDERIFQACDYSQRDEKNQSAQDITDDGEGMCPRTDCCHSPDSTLGTDCHPEHNQQDNIHANVGKQGDFFAGYTYEDDQRGE